MLALSPSAALSSLDELVALELASLTVGAGRASKGEAGSGRAKMSIPMVAE